MRQASMLDVVQEQFRNRFEVLRGTAYLNHAAMAPLPDVTVDAMRQSLDLQTTDPAGGYKRMYRHAQSARIALAGMIGARPDDVAITAGATAGILAIGHSLDWRAGDEVLLLDREFPANVQPWISMSRHKGFHIRRVAADGDATSSLISALGEQTRLVAVSDVNPFTGDCIDIDRLGEACEQHGVGLCVDVSQGIAIVNRNIMKKHVRFVVASAHKSLLGPSGVGLLCATPEARAEMTDSMTGWRSLEDPFSLTDQVPIRSMAKFEAGTPNEVLLTGLATSLALVGSIDESKIATSLIEMRARLDSLLSDIGCDVYTRDAASPIVCFSHAAKPADEIVDDLAAGGVMVSLRDNAVRIAVHFYNAVDDLERLARVLTNSVSKRGNFNDN